jgi:phosphopantothenoylcysteine decarboxylase/phosphopantothenate--cysteine ligase
MTEENIKNKKILIGITAGIAIYKICTLVRLFVRNGAQVKVIMTENATKLVSPTTFQALTGSPVYVSMFPPTDFNALDHINLANWADIFILVPATANTIGKIVNGIGDNLLTTVILALPQHIPLIVAPAMNVNMWENIFVQENIKKLKKRKNCYIIGPTTGILAEGIKGRGRMVEPEEIFKLIKKIFSKKSKKK